MVVAGRIGLGGYAYIGTGGGTGGGGGGGGRHEEGDGLNRWEDNLANVILGMEPNAPLAYATVLEPPQTITSKLGGHGCRLERER